MVLKSGTPSLERNLLTSHLSPSELIIERTLNLLPFMVEGSWEYIVVLICEKTQHFNEVT